MEVKLSGILYLQSQFQFLGGLNEWGAVGYADLMALTQLHETIHTCKQQVKPA